MTLKTAAQYVPFGERGIALSRRVSSSLKLQLFCAVLISLLAGFTVFGISFLLGNTALDKTIYGHSFAGKMADQQFSRLQKYVEEESISTRNLQRLNVWCCRGDKVYLAIYQNGVLIYESYPSGKQDSQMPVTEMEDPENEYILTLHGDEKVRAFLYYYAGDAFYFWMTILSGLLAFVAFSLCFVVLISRKVAYITQLKHELDILSGGQLECPVTITGRDELGELASGIDQMRRSIMKHQENEIQMRSANSELITAMSHDLRTPLTSLLAYLEIVERRKYTDEEQMHILIHKSVRQTMRIKHMADQLFEYFRVYATEWESADMETIDADQLFQQILGDYAYAMENKGLSVKTDFVPAAAQIKTNADLLQRALDNLYSNLLKYADPEEPVRISYSRENGCVLLSIANGVRIHQAKNESTGIGLITCRRIIEYHKGRFASSENDGGFFVTVSLPVQK